MNKTVFKISKMDCPSEENLIRMQLDNFNDIFDLDFKICLLYTSDAADEEES